MIFKTSFLPFNIKVEKVPKKFASRVYSRNYNKIFCVGFGKTGTTSLEKLLQQFGLNLGNQPVAEILAEDWAVHKRLDRIIGYCHTADAFQDVPFMLPGLFKELDREFPNSKFILTVRDNSDQWFQSLKRFHTKIFSADKTKAPTITDLRNTVYRYKGWTLDTFKFFWDYPQTPLYDEVAYKKKYTDHNDLVNNYFLNRRDNFIQINLAQKNDFEHLIKFLNVETRIKGFPWVNKSI